MKWYTVKDTPFGQIQYESDEMDIVLVEWILMDSIERWLGE